MGEQQLCQAELVEAMAKQEPREDLGEMLVEVHHLLEVVLVDRVLL
jgi:hypothetical protein